jgi:hypothetical protein
MQILALLLTAVVGAVARIPAPRANGDATGFGNHADFSVENGCPDVC